MTVIQVNELNINGYILSVTTRSVGDAKSVMEELTFRTIGAWLHIARLIEQENYTSFDSSVEDRFTTEMQKSDTAFVLLDQWGESRVTIWDTYRGNKRINFHLNSDDNMQNALDTWCAQQTALERVKMAFPQTAPNITQDTPPAVNPPEWDAIPSANAPSAPTAPNTAQPNGVVAATRAPNPNTPQYTHGQLVSFSINKIEITSNNGSAVYKFWGPLGQRYALLSLYMKKSDGTPQPAYEALKPILAPLGLSLEKPSINGNWIALAQASHATKDNVTKEYMNIQNLTAI